MQKRDQKGRETRKKGHYTGKPSGTANENHYRKERREHFSQSS